MRRVSKGAEPPCLAEVRREVKRVEIETGSPILDRWAYVTDCKSAIRDALRRDQHELCVYCGGRLTDRMKVEHFEPRSARPDLILDWSNLLGCCPGTARDGTKTITHCDSHRTPYVHNPPSPPTGILNIHPVTSGLDLAAIFRIRVRGSSPGEIVPATPEAKADLAALNLNAAFLVQNRGREIEKLRTEFARYAGNVTRVVLTQKYKAATTPGRDGLPPYAHVVAQYVKAKLDRSK